MYGHISTDEIHNLLVTHVCHGDCFHGFGEACQVAIADTARDGTPPSIGTVQIASLSRLLSGIRCKPLLCVLKFFFLEYECAASLRSLRWVLRMHIRSLRRGKNTLAARQHRVSVQQAQRAQADEEPQNMRANWPQTPSCSLKEELLKMFREETS